MAHTPLVVIPTYGEHHFTMSVVRQLVEQNECERILVYDNPGRGVFEPPVFKPTTDRIPLTVYSPSKRSGWLESCNNAFKNTFLQGEFSHLILLNNDTTLSPFFVSSLLEGFDHSEDVAIVGPLYDDVYAHQYPKGFIKGKTFRDARVWLPNETDHRVVPFVDGTCMAISREFLLQQGALFDEAFKEHGWGADYDICIRARQANKKCVVSTQAFLNHAHQGTAKKVGRENGYDYATEAAKEMGREMLAKYGQGWVSLVWQK